MVAPRSPRFIDDKARTPTGGEMTATPTRGAAPAFAMRRLLSPLRSFHDERMADSVEQAVRLSVEEQAELPTPTGRARFTVKRIDTRGVTLLFGPKCTPTFFS